MFLDPGVFRVWSGDHQGFVKDSMDSLRVFHIVMGP